MPTPFRAAIFTASTFLSAIAGAQNTPVSAPPVAPPAVEFACGTLMQNGSFYTENGGITCPGPTAKSPVKRPVLCFYQAQCTPVTKELRAYLLEANGEKVWENLTDNQITRTLIRDSNLARKIPFSFEFHNTAVQCLGDQGPDGKPHCPKVNDCVNPKRGPTVTLMGQLKPLKEYDLNKRPEENSDGFKLEQESGTAPKGVSR